MPGMKSNTLLLLALLFSNYCCVAATWYVRPDGGDRSQCTGQSNSARPGRGTKQPCAFRHPYYLFTTDQQYGETPKWVIAGGDTVMIADGEYRIGYKGPQARDSWQFCPGDPFGCHMPPLPSGSAAQHTRLLGENYQHCTSRPVFFGGYGVDRVLDLSGSAYVDVQCLEITDHGSCAHIGNVNHCRTDYPLDDYASNGVVTGHETHDVQLIDLNIHGLSSNGIRGPVSGNISATRVRVAGNSGAGWNFDDGTGTSSQGTITLLEVTVEWNGCSEEHPIMHRLPYHHCTDDNSAGYGDGIGTATSTSVAGWQWRVEQSTFRYNTQDGLDLLHVQGANSTATITGSQFYGNMGNQVKLGGMMTSAFRNNVVIGNCRYLSVSHADLPQGYNAQLSDFCRAGGSAFLKQMQNGEKDFIQNNSFAGMNGAPVYLADCLNGAGSCSSASMRFDNNLIVGFRDHSREDSVYVPALDSAEQTNYFLQAGGSRRNNLMFHTRSANPIACGGPGSKNEICNADPKLAAETDIDNLDFHLGPNSAAKGAGVAISELTTDIANVRRNPAHYDIGAYAYGSGVNPAAQQATTSVPEHEKLISFAFPPYLCASVVGVSFCTVEAEQL